MLKNVRKIDKGPKPPFMDNDVYEKSSDVIVWNLYEQDWQTIHSEGLARLFNGRDEFEQLNRNEGSA
ncbi:MAG TPA: hypothetical protein VNM69_00485 [Bacillus sp. (in: firmicutes)]|uniref:hypothetical protein n=1 Tax=Bacillus litorisediminis TaxID=2922713 RepID=UPI001FAF13BD|nr:hypothetical protein [Bacillus litorisediminis]HWO74372.1 hypothetical protein [Bacillus sp. (in: firmicutes)]